MQWLPPPLLQVGEPDLLIQLSPTHLINMVEHTAWGFGRESPDPSAFPTCGEGFLLRFGSTDTVDSVSVVDVKPGESI